jgi:hypothetical protein
MVRSRIVAVAALVGLLLTGCTQTNTNADTLRVGDVSVDDSQIEQIVGPEATRLTGLGVTDDLRQSAAELTIFREVARRYAAENGITPGAPDYETMAQQFQSTTDDPYVRLNAEAIAYRTALINATTARTPTEAEMHEVYDGFVQLVGPVATYDDIRGELLNLAEYGQSLALRDGLTAAMDRYGVTVSPRYQPLREDLLVVTLAAGGQLTLVSMPIGPQGTGAVRDEG